MNSNLNGGNLFLINNPYQPQHQQPVSTFISAAQTSNMLSPNAHLQIHSPNPNGELDQHNNNSSLPLMFMNIFENNNSGLDKSSKQSEAVSNNNNNAIYECSDIDNEAGGLNEQTEPMLRNQTNHYASTGLIGSNQQSKLLTSQENCKI